MITYIFKNKAFFDYWLGIKIFIELLFTLNENFKSSSLISPPLYKKFGRKKTKVPQEKLFK